MPQASKRRTLSSLLLLLWANPLLQLQLLPGILLKPSQAMRLNTISSKITSANTRYPNLLLVMVHGLDSSSKTWIDTMKTLEKDVACIAVDQRGCGYTPFGTVEEFSQQSLVADLHETIQEHSQKDKKKVVLLGHSLGGRIVMGYAAKHPEWLSALIVEDMDIEPRIPEKNGFVVLKEYDGLFDRLASNKEEMIQKFLSVGYPQSFVDKALEQGRIEPVNFRDGEENPALMESKSKPIINASWWSHVNPDFRKYCYPEVLSTKQGGFDCDTILSSSKTANNNLPCHILVAGEEGTVCIEDSVQEMHQRLGGNPKATIHRYPNAGHSIHSTAPEEFIATIRRILEEAAAAAAAASTSSSEKAEL